MEEARLTDVTTLAAATSDAISSSALEAAADLHRLLGISTPTIPDLR